MKQLVPLTLTVLLILAACNTPQPLPIAPTAIPTLIPATLPPPATATPRPAVISVTFPAVAPSAQAGQAIYQAHCATCHGVDGQGTVEKARDFSDMDYLRGAVPADFYQVITDGEGQMPGFKDQLSDEERWNTTFYLWSFAVKTDQLALGKTVYDVNCVTCHGPDGQGTIPQSPRFSVEFIASYPANQFYHAVTAGKGIMPAWQDRLSVEDRWASVEYARAFVYQPLGEE
jgi:mono/diheme cytochrome c family protein